MFIKENSCCNVFGCVGDDISFVFSENVLNSVLDVESSTLVSI